jgi:hypothetical protein
MRGLANGPLDFRTTAVLRSQPQRQPQEEQGIELYESADRHDPLRKTRHMAEHRQTQTAKNIQQACPVAGYGTTHPVYRIRRGVVYFQTRLRGSDMPVRIP